MSKPWLEDWRVRACGTVVADAAGGGYYKIEDDDERAHLAAAAPELVRALLAVEHDADDGACICGACDEMAPRHRSDCIVDAALTAAGLPDQASRDEARREMGR